MPDWLSIPRLVDVILLGMALEAFWLLWRHRRAGASGAPPMLLHLMSGALLLACYEAGTDRRTIHDGGRHARYRRPRPRCRFAIFPAGFLSDSSR